MTTQNTKAATPGPWEVRDQHPNRSCLQVFAGRIEVAVLYGGVDGSKDANDIWRDDHERVANARLIAQAPALLEALQWLEQIHRRDGEGYNECFERIGELFRRQTGHLRPGKDASPHAGSSVEERQAVWDKWVSDGLARARAAIAAATGEA